MPEPGDTHWFQPVARFLGADYLRHAFTKGTAREVEFLVGALDLEAGQRLLDVGCGPGRHALELAAQGIDVTGVDISADFIAIAQAEAERRGVADHCRFEIGDVRELDRHEEFDAVISLCQGGFGLLGGPGGSTDADVDVLRRMATALRPGGRLAVSAFSAYFAARHLEVGEEIDVGDGVLHEVSQVRGPANEERPFDLWTTLFTSRELRLMARNADLTVDAIHGVTPGKYAATPPTIDDPELLLLATRPIRGA